MEKGRDYDERDALAAIGSTLLIVQMAERMIKFCIGYALPKDGSLTLEELESHKAEESRRALGHFLAQLRRRVNVEPAFDDRLCEFLDLRNKLAHNLSEIPGIGFNTADEVAFTIEWSGKLAGLAWQIHNVFMGVIRSWQEQIGMGDDFANVEFFREVDKDYKPLVTSLFTSKKS